MLHSWLKSHYYQQIKVIFSFSCLWQRDKKKKKQRLSQWENNCKTPPSVPYRIAHWAIQLMAEILSSFDWCVSDVIWHPTLGPVFGTQREYRCLWGLAGTVNGVIILSGLSKVAGVRWWVLRVGLNAKRRGLLLLRGSDWQPVRDTSEVTTWTLPLYDISMRLLVCTLQLQHQTHPNIVIVKARW